MKNVLFILFCTGIMFGQEIELATDVVDYYSIDRFNNEIYFEQYYYPGNGAILKRIMKTNVSGDYFIETDLEEIPIFANLSNKYVYAQHDSSNNFIGVYEHYLNSGIDKLLYNSKLYPKMYSPNDENLLIFEGIYNYESDSIITLPSFDWQEFYWEGSEIWGSDSTLLYLHKEYNTTKSYLVDYNSIIRLNINTQLIDTLLIIPGFIDRENEPEKNNITINAFAYNVEKDLLAIAEISAGNNVVKIYDFTKVTPELIYSSGTLDFNESCTVITQLIWAPNNDWLAIAGTACFNSASAMFVFSLDDNHLYQIFNPFDTDSYGQYGIINNVKWIDNDNLCYINHTTKTLNSFNIKNIVTVDELQKTDVVNNILLKNYPNPFNTQTNISYTVSKYGKVVIEVFNSIGQIVFRKDEGKKNPGTYTLYWDGKNLFGSGCASGIYIIKVQQVNDLINFNNFSKVILLK